MGGGFGHWKVRLGDAAGSIGTFEHWSCGCAAAVEGEILGFLIFLQEKASIFGELRIYIY